jgi:hemoglobin/transferrin/lactoferrin receptor protein
VKREYVDRLMPLTVHGRVGWEAEDSGCWAELGGTWAADADRLSTRDEGDTSRIPPGGTPGYAVFHLRGGVRLGEHWTLDVGLENLANEDYRVHGSGQNSPGRNLVVGLTFNG